MHIDTMSVFDELSQNILIMKASSKTVSILWISGDNRRQEWDLKLWADINGMIIQIVLPWWLSHSPLQLWLTWTLRPCASFWELGSQVWERGQPWVGGREKHSKMQKQIFVAVQYNCLNSFFILNSNG